MGGGGGPRVGDLALRPVAGSRERAGNEDAGEGPPRQGGDPGPEGWPDRPGPYLV